MEARIAERTDIAVIRVLIADDHAIVRDGLRALIYAQSRLVVVGEAANGAEAFDRTRMLRPHVVVIDVSMPNVNGIEATARITKECPGVKVLALSMHEERGYVARVFRAGADGYALKRSASSELVRAIRAVVGGERYLDPSLAGALIAEHVTHHPKHRDGITEGSDALLTTRESEVLRLLALGYSNREIAGSLGISVKTVETHRASGMSRLRLTGRAALVRLAIAEGWFDHS